MIQFSETNSRLSALRSLLTVVLCCGLFTFIGCRPEAAEEDDKSTDKTTSKTSALNKETQCDKLIKNATHMCAPERFTIETDPEAVVGLLNDWANTCGDLKSQLDEAEINKWYGEDFLKEVNDNRFNLYDATHIRNSVMYHNIWTKVAQDQETDLARVVSAFNFVIRNVVLHYEAGIIPLKKHEVVFWGLGTAEDRAVFFADLLRQNRIDSIIITPADRQEDKDAWLVGVLLNDGIYLFDTRLGLPIPGPDHQPGDWDITDVATLKEVRENDDLLRFLDADEETRYPLVSTDLQKFSVGLIGYPTLWESRFESLQNKLTEEQHFLLYDGLIDGQGGQGAISRVIAQAEGMYSAEDLQVWDFPAKRFKAREEITEDVEKYVQQFSQTFSAYFKCEVNDNVSVENLDEKLSVKPTKSMAKARLAYMSGKEREAIKNYTAIRIVTLTEIIPLLQQYKKELPLLIHVTAMDNALFWLAVAQIEVGEYQPAIDTLNEYMRKTQGKGRWMAAAHEKLIYCNTRVEKPAISVQLTKQIIEMFPADSYSQYHFKLVLKRLRFLQQKEREEKKKAAAEKS